MIAMLGALSAMLVCGCSAALPTQLFVVIDSDLLVPEELDTITLELERAPDPTLGPFVQILDPANRFSVPLPVSVDLRERTLAEREVTLVVDGYRRQHVQLEQRATVQFAPNRTEVVCMSLRASCVGVTCEAGTCRNGACVAPSAWARPEYDDAAVSSCRLPGLDAGGDLDGAARIDGGDAAAIAEAGGRG